MDLLIRINQWWLAALTVCSPIIGIGLFITGFYTHLTGLIYAAVPLTILIPAGVTTFWLFSTGKFLYRSRRRDAETYRTFRRFRISILAVSFYAVLLSFVLLFSVEKFFSFHYFSDLFRLEMKHLFNLSVMLLPLHFISVCATWYSIHFIAKYLDQENSAPAFTPGYFRNLALLAILPVGLVRIHPYLRMQSEKIRVRDSRISR